MKKTSVILLIFAIIVAVHAVILFLFIRNGKGEEPAAQETSGAQAQTPAEDPNVKMVTAEEFKRLQAMRRMKKPFNYTYAVQGNIRQIQASRTPSAGILVDLNTRNVLWAKNPQKSVPIASMTKTMTVLLAYEEVLKGGHGITLDSPVQVSKAAYKIGGSQVYLDPREVFPLRDLMMAASIKSANDAAYLIAEFIGGGDVQVFVDKMNARAKSLGMNNTVFHNPHGLPGQTAAEDNKASPEDMVRIAEATMLYPQLMQWAGTWQAPFREPGTKGCIMMRNHNHLLPGADTPSPGVTGLKTGFIQRAGYCIVVTCTRGGRNMAAVVMGFDTWKNRDKFVAALLNWGYARAADPAKALLEEGRP